MLLRSTGALLSFFIPLWAVSNPDSLCLRQKLVFQTLLGAHYQPPVFDASTNAGVLDLFIAGADERNIFFLAGDRKALLVTVYNTEAPEVFCSLVSQTSALFIRRLEQLDSIISVLEKSELKLDGRDSLTFIPSRRNRVLCNDLADLSKRIERRIKYESLQDICSGGTPAVDAGRYLEDAGRPGKNAFARSFRRLRQYLAPFADSRHLESHLADRMSNAIAGRCDPHSNYFNRSDYEDYHTSLSVDENSFGFSAEENESGVVFISEVVPGGPASRTSLGEGDEIVSFTCDGNEVCIDSCGSEAFLKTIYEQPPASLRLKVRKPDMRVESVELVRERLPSRENTLNSFVVTLEGRKMGYLPIPSFYLGSGETGRQGCAYDLAREIISLGKDSVEGLLIDLRYNGGGSMREAIAVAGIFIDHGPVAIYRPGDGKIFPLKDFHRGTIWDGPLVILVNAASASASEFFSAAMQDLDRAIIVGTPTFGKGTAQSILPADTSELEGPAEKAGRFGFVKVTAGKFYRVTGAGIQSRGIVPDIPIPGIIDKVMERETDQPYRLEGDSIEQRTVTGGPGLPRQELLMRSQARTGSGRCFPVLAHLADSLKASRQKQEKVALSIRAYRQYANKQKKFHDRLERLLGGAEEPVLVSPGSDNSLVIAMSPVLQRISAGTVASISKDLVLNEGLHVLHDLIISRAK